MKIIALMGDKGGAGRSMLAVQLAVAASGNWRRVRLASTSPHGAVMNWHGRRGEGPDDFALGGPIDLSGPPHEGVETAQALGCDWLFVDCGARAEFSGAIAQASSLVLLPFRPALPDIHSLLAYNQRLPYHRIPRVLAICNAARAGTGEAREALEFLVEDSQIQCARTVIHDRVLFRRTFAAGKGVAEMRAKSRAKDEINALYQELNL